MSRMTKFLRQKCILERAVLGSNGEVEINRYGESLYSAPETINCRCEQVVADVLTANGSIMKSSTRYFIDEKVPVKAGDMIDGRKVLLVSDFVNSYGKTEGYECHA